MQVTHHEGKSPKDWHLTVVSVVMMMMMIDDDDDDDDDDKVIMTSDVRGGGCADSTAPHRSDPLFKLCRTT